MTIDGNEYLKRAKCDLPKEKCCVVTCQRSTSVAPPPVTGGKDQKPSKFCASHLNHEATGVSEPVDVPPEFHSGTEGVGLLPEDQQTLQGCTKKENILLFYETTAGMLALIHPCGIVVSMTEMFTCESQTQVFLFLLKTFCITVNTIEDFERLKYMGYDRACGLVPFLNNQAKNGSAGGNCS